MLSNCIGMTAFAAEAKATTLRLEAMEGTVTVLNKRGISRKAIEGSKIYSGDTITTALSSYAYISLDDNKVVKMDANSQVEIKQSGKKLEVALSSGELFFDVKKPLATDENMTIRTSTMSMGIRGTSGFLNVETETMSQVSLLTGTVIVQTSDASNTSDNPQKVQILTGGNTVTSIRNISPDDTTDANLTTKPLAEESVPGFVKVAVKEDKDLQEEIGNKTDLDVEKIILDAEPTLKEDERLAAEEAKKCEDALKEQQENMPDSNQKPFYEEDKKPSGGGGSTPPTPSGPPPMPQDPPAPQLPYGTLSTSAPTTSAQFQAAFAANNTVLFEYDQVMGDLTIPANNTLIHQYNGGLGGSPGDIVVNHGTMRIVDDNGGSNEIFISIPIINEGTMVAGDRPTTRSLNTRTTPRRLYIRYQESVENKGTIEVNGLVDFYKPFINANSTGIINFYDGTVTCNESEFKNFSKYTINHVATDVARVALVTNTIVSIQGYTQAEFDALMNTPLDGLPGNDPSYPNPTILQIAVLRDMDLSSVKDNITHATDKIIVPYDVNITGDIVAVDDQGKPLNTEGLMTAIETATGGVTLIQNVTTTRDLAISNTATGCTIKKADGLKNVTFTLGGNITGGSAGVIKLDGVVLDKGGFDDSGLFENEKTITSITPLSTDVLHQNFLVNPSATPTVLLPATLDVTYREGVEEKPALLPVTWTPDSPLVANKTGKHTYSPTFTDTSFIVDTDITLPVIIVNVDEGLRLPTGDITTADITAAFASNAHVLLGAYSTITDNGTITVPLGKTLTIYSIRNDGSFMELSNHFVNHGTIIFPEQILMSRATIEMVNGTIKSANQYCLSSSKFQTITSDQPYITELKPTTDEHYYVIKDYATEVTDNRCCRIKYPQP